MSLLGNLFKSNLELSHDQRVGLRVSIKRWGLLFGILAVSVLIVMGAQEPSPDQGLAFDIAQKASFGLMRLVLATVGSFLGAFVGYVVYQILESSLAGAHIARIEEGDSDTIKQVKLLNRGILLTAICAVCVLVMALALSGAGGR